MLELEIPDLEYFDSKKNEFYNIKAQTLRLEHSLVSISKWESKWCKHFLGNRNKTSEELLDYIRCMTLTQNVDPLTYKGLRKTDIDKIVDYIEAPMTATTFNDSQKPPSLKIITSEEIYYQMIAFGIPFECQKWHINRLLTLIKICSIRENPKKMGKTDIMRQNAELNKARRMAMRSKG